MIPSIYLVEFHREFMCFLHVSRFYFHLIIHPLSKWKKGE